MDTVVYAANVMTDTTVLLSGLNIQEMIYIFSCEKQTALKSERNNITYTGVAISDPPQ